MVTLGILLKSVCCVLLTLVLTSCGHVRVVDGSAEQKSLPFIEDGKTTKDEVLSRLGVPSSMFEGGRIIIYHMMKLGQFEGFEVDPEKKFIYNLILVFDEQNILQRHRMLDLRPWTP